jgi:hypothetical protein
MTATITTSILHNCYRISARAALWSLVIPLALAALLPGTLPAAVLVSLASILPATGACLLFSLSACSYSLARDMSSVWRAPMAVVAGISLCAGMLLWTGFFAFLAL